MASLRFFSFFLLVGCLLSILYLTLSSPLISSVRLSCNSFLISFPYIVGINNGTVFFGGNYYQVKGAYRGHEVLCVNTGQEIVIYHEGEEIGRFGYLPKAKGMVRLSEEAIVDTGVYLSDRVRGWAVEVARRQVALYHDIVARQAL